jgi:ribonuclease I
MKTTTTIPKLLAKAQKIFNAYIRLRDSEDGYFTCISCSKTLPVSQMNAGHYVPVKNGSYLRLHEWNVNGECCRCNAFDEFHLIGYRRNLIDKIGLDAVEWLEAHRHEVKKFTRQDIENIIITYGKCQP